MLKKMRSRSLKKRLRIHRESLKVRNRGWMICLNKCRKKSKRRSKIKSTSSLTKYAAHTWTKMVHLSKSSQTRNNQELSPKTSNKYLIERLIKMISANSFKKKSIWSRCHSSKFKRSASSSSKLLWLWLSTVKVSWRVKTKRPKTSEFKRK